MRKRTPRIERETPAARARRDKLDEEIEAMLARMPEPTAEEERKTKRLAARFTERADRDGVDAAIEWAARKLGDKPASKRPTIDHYAAHRATVANTVAPEAGRPAPTSEDVSAADETPEPKKARRRRPAGLVGYIDPRLIDEDDWED